MSSGRSAQLSVEQLAALESRWPGDEAPENFADRMRCFLRDYERGRLYSTDSMATERQTIETLDRVAKHLRSALSELVKPESIGILSKLSQAYREEAADVTIFADQLHDLMHAADETLATMKKNPLVLGGRRHTRRTRHYDRDHGLILDLVMLFMSEGFDLTGKDHWELDEACRFIEALLKEAGIPTPKPGDTSKGEDQQGRLRRIVKDRAREVKEFAEKMERGEAFRGSISPLDD